MIWGFTLYPGEPCTKIVDKEVHLTMAALDGDTGVNDVTRKKCCQVLMMTESSEFLLLCTLVEGLIYQQNVDLQLMPGERVTFCAQGGRVHLTGYSQVGQNVDVNKNSESRTEATEVRRGPEPLTEQQAVQESDVIEELFSEQGFTTSSSGSKASKVPVQTKKDVPQKKVKTKTSNNTISPGEHSGIKPKKSTPQEKVENKNGKTTTEQSCIQPPKDVLQKKVETEIGKTTNNLEKQSCIVIKEEPMELSVVESEPEVVSSMAEATPKQTTGSVMLGDSQESAPTTKDKDNASHLTSRSNSPVECINQALSITYIPSELEDGMVSQSDKESEVSEIQVVENGDREVENRRLYQERGMAPTQTSKAHDISTVTHTTGPISQWRESFSILGGSGQENQGISQLIEKRDLPLPEAVARSDVLKTAEHYQDVCPEIQPRVSDRPYSGDEKSHEEGRTLWAHTKAHDISRVMQTTGPESQKRTLPCVGISQHTSEIDQRNQGRDAVLAEPVERPNIPNETECYQYEVRKIISSLQQEIRGKKVTMMSLLGEENKSSGVVHQGEERATLSSAVAANSCSKRKRPHPSEEMQGKQNPLKTSLKPVDNNMLAKKTRLTDKEKQEEAAMVSPSSSTAGTGIVNNNEQSQVSFENIKTGGPVISSERNLPQVPLTTLPTPTASGTAKSNSGRRNKCDCCMKPSEERHKIMLGENRHWFCLSCYTTFSSDMELLKYCRIVPQNKHK